MSVQKIKIPRASDRKIAELFKELCVKYAASNPHVSTYAFTDIGQVSLVEEPTGAWKNLLEHDSNLIESVVSTIGGLTIKYARSGDCPPEHKSAIFDEIVFSWYNHSSPTNTEKLDIVAFINDSLCAFEIGRVAGNAATEEQSQLMAIHHSTLERLERLNESLIKESAEFRQGLEEKFEQKIKKVEEEFSEKKRQLELDQKAYLAKVDVKEGVLNEKLKVIDDRDNTHVRREIRDRMLNDVKQRISQFGVSKLTAAKRYPVLFGISFLALIFTLLLVVTYEEIISINKQYFSMLESIRSISVLGTEKLKAAGVSLDTVAKVSATDVDRTSLYWLWGRFTLLSFGLIGTVLYYIRWQNRWAEQHIVSEFQLQQFYIDVNRANWVLESCLEWRKETRTVLPKTIIQSISRGLFTGNSTEVEKVFHPADELASALLGSASKLKLKVGDNEIDFDKPKKITNKPVSVRSE